MENAASTSTATRNSNLAGRLLWAAIAIAGACCLAVVALRRGEPVNAIWIVTAAIAVFLVAHRFYARFIADKVLELDPSRATPAVLRNDGLDYVPTHKWVVFGHHFAAIAGAGPLVGPVLAAQMGYLPGTLWILVGVVFAGAVQDFMILGLSLRHGGRSLGQMLREELGEVPGIVAMVGVLVLMMIVLAVLALVVVKALTAQPVGHVHRRGHDPDRSADGRLPALPAPRTHPRGFAHRPGVAAGVDLVRRPRGRLARARVGVRPRRPEPGLAPHRLRLLRVGPAGVVAPRAARLSVDVPEDRHHRAAGDGDPLSAPRLQMPALTKFIDGTGPVFAGNLFPFLFITIACGAVSGWHSIIASGTTPKLLASEGQARLVGYGGMLMEAFVAIMALIAAASLHPGVYFAMNSPSALIGTTVDHAAATISGWGFMITPNELSDTARKIGEIHAAEPRGRRADAGRRDGATAAQHPAWRAHDGVLVPLRHPVRGAVHPHHRRRRHARRALHDPGDRGPDPRAAQAHRILDQQRHRHGRLRRRAGAISSTRARSIRSAASTRCGRSSASPIRCSPRSRCCWRRS